MISVVADGTEMTQKMMFAEVTIILMLTCSCLELGFLDQYIEVIIAAVAQQQCSDEGRLILYKLKGGCQSPWLGVGCSSSNSSLGRRWRLPASQMMENVYNLYLVLFHFLE